MSQNICKNFLYVTYIFPPMGGPGVQRGAKFCKYLPSYGWNPYVLTTKKITYLWWDYKLEKEIPKNIEIIRTESLDFLRLHYLLTRFFSKGKKIVRQNQS